MSGISIEHRVEMVFTNIQRGKVRSSSTADRGPNLKEEVIGRLGRLTVYKQERRYLRRSSVG